ncbi:unnamed protein product [Ambrosiozyma monospora]|uniref:Unnamed protein product n=1 Tax=Ambrosiozyma monospora TaxID=43982 RepID=A0A9W6TA02_AMBMO|nr:unnamed protein product [Ambrosiozyma monospora]
MSLHLATWNPTFYQALVVENETEPFITFGFSNISEDGRPKTRTCVLRGFLFDDRKTNILLFTTDKRSPKYKDILKNNFYESCFNFTKTRKQFRLSGVVKVISNDLQPALDIYTDPKPPLFKSDTEVLEYNHFPRQSINDKLNFKLLSPELEVQQQQQQRNHKISV